MSGSYPQNTVAISTIDSNSYISLITTVNTSTDPALDPSEWTLYSLQGPTGQTGYTGETGSTGPIGPIATFIGFWTSGSYPQNTVAISTIDSNSYISIITTVNTSTDPALDPSEWILYSLQGPTGQIGPTGETGSTGPIGPIATFIGLWTPGSYPQNTVAVSTIDDNSYISFVTIVNTSTDPANDLSEWALYSLHGQTGQTGNQGNIGDTGASGPTGFTGDIGMTGSSGPTGPPPPSFTTLYVKTQQAQLNSSISFTLLNVACEISSVEGLNLSLNSICLQINNLPDIPAGTEINIGMKDITAAHTFYAKLTNTGTQQIQLLTNNGYQGSAFTYTTGQTLTAILNGVTGALLLDGIQQVSISFTYASAGNNPMYFFCMPPVLPSPVTFSQVIFYPGGLSGQVVGTGPTGPAGVIAVSGANYGDYILWNGTSWITGDTNIAIGGNAGSITQGIFGVAVGANAGNISQGEVAIAVGYNAGLTNQGTGSIAIGAFAGDNQGEYSTIIGYNAGATGTAANSIILSAGPTGISSANPGFYVNPIRTNVNTSSTYALYYNYDGNGSGDVYEITVSTTSDGRLKTDISDTQLGLNFIEALHPVQYRWKDRNIGYLYDEQGNTPVGSNPGVRLHHGFVAQEVKTVLDSIHTDAGLFMELNDGPPAVRGLNALRYDEFISPIVKSIQELSALVKQQQQTIADLQARLANANL